MTTTVVLDTGGLEAWCANRPSHDIIVVMEVLRKAADGAVVVPSTVLVEALTGTPRDASIDRQLRSLKVEERLTTRSARTSARLRQGLQVSAVDAIVAEAALRTDAQYVITSDPDDLGALVERAGTQAVVIDV